MVHPPRGNDLTGLKDGPLACLGFFRPVDLYSANWFMYSRVARFFLVQFTKMGKYTKLPQSIPNDSKIYQMSVK
jgi:hypothetical protein